MGVQGDWSPCFLLSGATRQVIMARYEHLPIYQQAMAVAIHCEKVVAGFSRHHKYTLGTELRNTSREIVNVIVAANSAQEKLPRLLTLRERLESLLILMRLCKEVKAFKSFKAFQFAIEQVVAVSKQNEGWIRSVSHKLRGPESPAPGRLVKLSVYLIVG